MLLLMMSSYTIMKNYTNIKNNMLFFIVQINLGYRRTKR